MKQMDNDDEKMDPAHEGHQQVGIGRSMYFVPKAELQEFFEKHEAKDTLGGVIQHDADKMRRLEQDNAQLVLDLKHACQCLDRGCRRCQLIHKRYYPEVYGD